MGKYLLDVLRIHSDRTAVPLTTSALDYQVLITIELFCAAKTERYDYHKKHLHHKPT